MTHDNMKNFIDNRVELFIEKPFKENELLDLLYKTITKTPADSQAFSSKNEQRKLFDLTELQRQSGNDPKFIREMLETLIISTNNGIADIASEIESALWDKVNLVAHRLASPLRFIMAGEAYNNIKQIENMTESELSISKNDILNQFHQFKIKFKQLEQSLLEHIQQIQ